MKFTSTSIPEVVLIEPRIFGDARGFFIETWNARKFAESGIENTFVQDNHSMSRQGTLRGLHYQIAYPQGKLTRVIAGEIYDVAVDLRRSSPTFKRWVGVILSADNKKMLWIPPGFAHGFYVLSNNAEVIYKCSDFYTPQHERCIAWDDPELNISWPLIDGSQPLLSTKDEKGSSFNSAEVYP